MKSSPTPHGPGFSFIDTYHLSQDKESILARKHLDPALPFFADHFPGRPLMPGVLMIEAAAQACGILWSARQAEEDGELTMLAQVQKFKIKQAVYPLETLEIRALLQRDFGALAQFEVAISVRQTEVAAGVLILGRKEPDEVVP